jgi:hypothetical protein
MADRVPRFSRRRTRRTLSIERVATDFACRQVLPRSSDNTTVPQSPTATRRVPARATASRGALVASLAWKADAAALAGVAGCADAPSAVAMPTTSAKARQRCDA